MTRRLDLRDVKVVTKLGGTVDDSEMVQGMVFDHRAAKAANGPTRIENAKIALVQFCISPPKTDLENNVIISDYAQMDRILKEERNYILSMIKKIRASGCNVLLVQKSILRDATTDLSLHYLVSCFSRLPPLLYRQAALLHRRLDRHCLASTRHRRQNRLRLNDQGPSSISSCSSKCRTEHGTRANVGFQGNLGLKWQVAAFPSLIVFHCRPLACASCAAAAT